MAFYDIHTFPAELTPYPDRFNRGEQVLSVAAPIDTAPPGSTWYFSRKFVFEAGVYRIYTYADDAATWWIGRDKASSRMVLSSRLEQGVVSTEFYIAAGEQRFDLILHNFQHVNNPCYFIFSIWRNDKLIYASSPDHWVLSDEPIDDNDLPSIGDSRLTLPVWSVMPNWKDGITERLMWYTDVMESESGSEQRRAVRVHPRRSFDVSFLRQEILRSRMDFFFTGVGKKDFLMPLWHEQVRMLEGITIGAPGVSFSAGSTQWREFRSGDLVWVNNGDPNDWDLLEVAEVEPSRFGWARAPRRPWPAGTRIFPCRVVRMIDSPQMSNPGDRVGVVQARFEQVDSDIRDSAWGGVVGDEPFFRYTPNRKVSIELDWMSNHFILDNQSDSPLITDASNDAKVSMKASFGFFGRQAVTEFRRTLAAAAGRAKQFYIPSFTHDLEPMGYIGPDEGPYLDILPSGYWEAMTRPQPTRLFFRIERYDEESLYRNILNVEPIYDRTERHYEYRFVSPHIRDAPLPQMPEMDRLFDLDLYSTMMREPDGTVPVDGPAQVVGWVSDVSQNNGPATQRQLINRPITGRVPRGGRRNRLRYTDQLDSSAWVKDKANVTLTSEAGPLEGTPVYLLSEDSSNGLHNIHQQNIPVDEGFRQTLSLYVKPAVGTRVIRLAVFGAVANIDVASGEYNTFGNSNLSVDLSPADNGFQRVSLNRNPGSGPGGVSNAYISLAQNVSSASNSYVGDGVSGLYVSAPQVERGTEATPYQRVTNGFDVVEEGVPDVRYVNFNPEANWLEFQLDEPPLPDPELPGVHYVEFDENGEPQPLLLPPILNGTVVIAGTGGVWVDDDYTFAGGTFTLGGANNTYPGGPRTILDALGDLIPGGTFILNRQITIEEKGNFIRGLGDMGAPGLLSLGPELVDPDAWAASRSGVVFYEIAPGEYEITSPVQYGGMTQNFSGALSEGDVIILSYQMRNGTSNAVERLGLGLPVDWSTGTDWSTRRVIAWRLPALSGYALNFRAGSRVEGGTVFAKNISVRKLILTPPAEYERTMVIATTKGTWIGSFDFAGGTFDMGPTTFTNGPADLFEVIGNDLIGFGVKNRKLTHAERAGIIRYYEQRSGKGEISVDPDPWEPPYTEEEVAEMNGVFPFNSEGPHLYTPVSGFNLLVFEGRDGDPAWHKGYPLRGSDGEMSQEEVENRDQLISDLNSLTTTSVVLLYTSMHFNHGGVPPEEIFNEDLVNAIKRVGGTDTYFSDFKDCGAYMLLGVPGVEPGQGVERYAGTQDYDRNAEIEYIIHLYNGRPTEVEGPPLDPMIGERLTLDEPLPPIAREDIKRISMVTPARLDQDAIELKHHTAQSRFVETTLAIRQIYNRRRQ